jgi:hypothetical protein
MQCRTSAANNLHGIVAKRNERIAAFAVELEVVSDTASVGKRFEFTLNAVDDRGWVLALAGWLPVERDVAKDFLHKNLRAPAGASVRWMGMAPD